MPDSPDADKRAKIGVKTAPGEGLEDWRVARDSLFMTYADDLRMARGDAIRAIRFREVEIEMCERAAAGEGTLPIYFARCYGESADPVAKAAAFREELKRAREHLEEIEDAPGDHHEDLWQVLQNPRPDDARPLYSKSLTRFVGAFGNTEPEHVEFLVCRAAMEASMHYLDPAEVANWDGTRWWTGDGKPTKLSVDPTDLVVDYTTIDRREISSTEELVEASLYSAMKVAAIVNFHTQKDNEGPRAHWQYWLDRELSILSQYCRVDYELDVVAGKLPAPDTVKRWEAEINVLDSEDQAKLRHWEAVCSYFYIEGEDVVDAEDIEWAEHIEGEAEETRLWAIQKRERIARHHRHRHRRRIAAFRRFGARARQSRGGSVRCRGSRRVASRSAGGGGSSDGDPDEPGEGSRRLRVGAAALAVLIISTWSGAAMTEAETSAQVQAHLRKAEKALQKALTYLAESPQRDEEVEIRATLKAGLESNVLGIASVRRSVGRRLIVDRRRRFGARSRQKGCPGSRWRGSRRGSANRSTGPPGDDDPPGEPEPARRRGLLGELSTLPVNHRNKHLVTA
jgi:hypothetical protein